MNERKSRDELEDPTTPNIFVDDSLVKTNRYVTVVIALICVMVHGNYMYNSVGFVVWWDLDPELHKENLQHIGLFTRSTAYYCACDMLLGAVMSNVLDIIGPKYFTLIGHVLAFIGWSLYQLPTKHAYIWLPISCMLQGSSIQAFTNSSLMLAKMFKRNRNKIMAMLGSCVDISLVLPMAFISASRWLTTQQCALGMNVMLLITGLLVVMIYPNARRRTMGQKTQSMIILEDQMKDHPDITLMRVFKTTHYMAICLFFVIVFTVFQIETAFMANIITMLPAGYVNAVNNYFSWSTIIGIVSCIWMGRIAEEYTITTVMMFYAILGPVTSICLYIMNKNSIVLGIFLYNIYKSSLFTMLFAYCAVFFPCRYTARCAALPCVAAALVFFPLLEFTQKLLRESISEYGHHIGTKVILEKILFACIIAGLASSLIFYTVLRNQRCSHQDHHVNINNPLGDVYVAAR